MLSLSDKNQANIIEVFKPRTCICFAANSF